MSQGDRESGRQKVRETESQGDRASGRQRDKEAERQRVRETERQRDKEQADVFLGSTIFKAFSCVINHHHDK